MRTLRSLPDNAPFWARSTTLGRCAKGVVTYAQSEKEKAEMLTAALADMKKGVVYFWAWPGQWTMDFFAVTKEDAVRLLLPSGGK